MPLSEGEVRGIPAELLDPGMLVGRNGLLGELTADPVGRLGHHDVRPFRRAASAAAHPPSPPPTMTTSAAISLAFIGSVPRAFPRGMPELTASKPASPVAFEELLTTHPIDPPISIPAGCSRACLRRTQIGP